MYGAFQAMYVSQGYTATSRPVLSRVLKIFRQ